MNPVEELNNLREEALRELAGAEELKVLESLRVAFLGKKGKLTTILKSIGKLPQDERKETGALSNKIKKELEACIKEKSSTLKASSLEMKMADERMDITLPQHGSVTGAAHPVNSVLIEICEIFISMGFSMAEGPEVDFEKYNFEMLNFPEDHPARDMQDTFYINNELLLRAHTSTVQIRTMLVQPPPVAIIASGKVYRKDADQTHSPMFHQIEGLMVDRAVTFKDLRGIVRILLDNIFHKDIPIRFRPSFFPFTEPSAEVDIGCTVCNGAGCKMCKDSGWLEIMGCGMVDPNVFDSVGIDPLRFTGLAFGMGVERIAMLKYRIPDIRMLFTNNMRFNLQFRGLR